MLSLPCLTHNCIRIHSVNRTSLDVCSKKLLFRQQVSTILNQLQSLYHRKNNTLAINGNINFIFSMVRVDRPLFTAESNY
jgi:hypothetical protein